MADLCVGDTRIELRRVQTFVPQHLTYGFNRHAVGQCYRRGKSMPGTMEGQPLRSAHSRGDLLKIGVSFLVAYLW